MAGVTALPTLSSPTFDWFITSPHPPRVHAFHEPAPGSRFSETFIDSNLTVPEGSFLLLMCAAFYNVTWAPARGGEKTNSGVCRGLITDPKDQWPSTECLTFERVKSSNSGLYICHHTPDTDPNLVTRIQLNVVSNETSKDARVVGQSFHTVFTLTPRPVELTVEYDIGSTCNDTCRGSWLLLPNTVLDGRYDNRSHKVVSSSESTAYAYVEDVEVSSTRRLSRLVMRRTCFKNSGFYHFRLHGMAPVEFSVTVEFSRTREIASDVVMQGVQPVFRARLFPGRVYDISCSSPDFGPASNKTSRMDFFFAIEPQFCSTKARFTQTDGPDGGYVIDASAFRKVSPKCLSPGGRQEPVPLGVRFSSFTLRSERPGKARCIFNWTYTDANGTERSNGSVSELQYKIVDRNELLTSSRNMLIERAPEGPPLIGDPMTISCVAPPCQHDRIVLEKQSNKLEFSDDYGIIRNDFEGAEVSVENNSMHVTVSLTYPKTTKSSGGLFSCFGSDHEVPAPERANLEITMVPPSPPIFDITENYTDRVYLEPGTHVQLSCYVQGQPKPEIRWFFDNRHLAPEDGTLDNENATLTIGEVGQYECRASNRHGQIKRSFKVVNENDEQKPNVTLIVVATVCGIALLASICFAVWLFRRWRMASVRKMHSLMLKPPQQTLPLESFMPVNDQIESLPYDDQYEVDKSKFTMCAVLGNGEYGKVYRGVLKTQNGDQDIAVKAPRDGFNVDHHKALISELKIMIYVRQHVNVLRIIGACTKDIQNAGFYIVTEYCNRGSLRDYLLKNRDRPCSTCEATSLRRESIGRGTQYSKNIQSVYGENELKTAPKHLYVNVQEGHQCSYFSAETLLSYAYQSATGMEYLAAKNVVHRDLALRNLLLHGDIVKIADFGLSRHHYRDVYKSRKYDCPLPVFWMALESILSYKYTEKSDVWSFGVVMWEMFSLGDSPYAGKRPDHQFVQWLREGNRMDAPKLAPAETYNLMLSCWNKDPDTRPTFSECKRRLGQHLDDCSSEAYRTLLLVLASAKAAADELRLTTATKQDSSEDGSAKYAIFGGSEKAKSVQSNSDLEVIIQSSCGSISSTESDKVRVTQSDVLCKPNVYQAPCIDQAPVVA